MTFAPFGAEDHLGADRGLLAHQCAAGAPSVDLTRRAIRDHAEIESELRIEDLEEWHRILFSDAGSTQRKYVGNLRGRSEASAVDQIIPTRQSFSLAPSESQIMELTQKALDDVINQRDGTRDQALIDAALMAMWFFTRQPFVDGNKRIGRCVALWICDRTDIEIDLPIHPKRGHVLFDTNGPMMGSLLDRDEERLLQFLRSIVR